MCLHVNAIGKKLLDVRSPVFARRQTDTVNDDQLRLCTVRPVILVGRRALGRRPQQAGAGAYRVYLRITLGQNSLTWNETTYWQRPLTWSLLSRCNVNDSASCTLSELDELRSDRLPGLVVIADTEQGTTELSQPGTRRVYVDETLQSGAQLILPVEQSHYIDRVLRLKAADELTLFNGKGGEFSAVVVTVSRHGVAVRIDNHIIRNVESPLVLHLVQGVSRGERMDTVMQKATELGVSRLTPVLTEFSVVRLDDAAKRDKRTAHWTRIALSACEQCGRTVPPVIDTPIHFDKWRQHLVQDGTRRIALHPTATTPLASLQPVSSNVMLLIGPEGGFSDNELGEATAAGFEVCSLGPRILRTETAAIAAIAVLQARWGDLA